MSQDIAEEVRRYGSGRMKRAVRDAARKSAPRSDGAWARRAQTTRAAGVPSPPLALKVLHPLHSESAEFTARFLNEARILANLGHSNVITIHDIGVEGELHYCRWSWSRAAT